VRWALVWITAPIGNCRAAGEFWKPETLPGAVRIGSGSSDGDGDALRAGLDVTAGQVREFAAA
jgi:hypothetical protein